MIDIKDSIPGVSLIVALLMFCGLFVAIVKSVMETKNLMKEQDETERIRVGITIEKLKYDITSNGYMLFGTEARFLFFRYWMIRAIRYKPSSDGNKVEYTARGKTQLSALRKMYERMLKL